jgi:uncharacterized membrane protein YGL010W
MATMNTFVLFGEHSSYYADRRNRACRAVEIPSIVVGILGLGRVTRLGPIDLAAAAAVAVLIFSAALDPRGILISLVVLVVFFLISTRLSWQVSLGAFIFGWGIQSMGHILEDTKQKEFLIRVRR